MKPHMDIQLHIDGLIKALNGDIKITHVKGHCDRGKEPLTWIQKLNVRADELATQQRERIEKNKQKQFDVWFPNSQICLYINDIPIHKWMDTSVHRAATSNDLIDFLKHKFLWTTKQCSDIDWFSRGRAFDNNSAGKRPWATKFSHNMLPLNGEKHFQNIQETCPICKKDKETTNHFIRCRGNKCETQKTQKRLTTIYRKHNVDPFLRTLINRIVDGEDCGRATLIKEIGGFPYKYYRQLIKAQEQLGWVNFLKGYASMQWDYHQRRYLYEMELEVPNQEPAWLQQVIFVCLEQMHKRWLYRNECVHGKNEETGKEHLLLRVRGLYEQKEKMLQQDHHCFIKDIQDWDKAPKWEIQNWLNQHTFHVRKCVQLSAKQMKAQIPDIRTWFSNKGTITQRTRRHQTQTEHERGKRSYSQQTLQGWKEPVTNQMKTDAIGTDEEAEHDGAPRGIQTYITKYCTSKRSGLSTRGVSGTNEICKMNLENNVDGASSSNAVLTTITTMRNNTESEVYDILPRLEMQGSKTARQQATPTYENTTDIISPPPTYHQTHMNKYCAKKRLESISQCLQ